MKKAFLLMLAFVLCSTALFAEGSRDTIVVTKSNVERGSLFKEKPVDLSKTKEKPDYPRLRVALDAGYGFRPGETYSMNNLSKGFSYDCSATWYFSRNWGMGLKYQDFRTKGVQHIKTGPDGSYIYTDDSESNGTIEDKVNVFFVGPFASYRFLSADKRHAFIVNLGIGKINYRDYGKVMDVKITTKSGNAGVSMDLGYDFRITKHFCAGASASVSSGIATLLYITDSEGLTYSYELPTDEYINLTNMSFNIGVRYIL